MIAMEESDRVGDARNKGAGCEPVSTHIQTPAARAVKVFLQTIGLIKGQSHLADRNFQTHMTEIVHWGHAMVGNLIDVEGKFGADMLRLALGIVDDRTVLLGQFWKLDGHSEVDRLCVPYCISDVVGQRPHREREFVGIACIAEKVDYEIARADIVGKVGKRLVP